MATYPLDWYRIHFTYKTIFSDEREKATYDIWESCKSAAEMSFIKHIDRNNRDNESFSPGSKMLDCKVQKIQKL